MGTILKTVDEGTTWTQLSEGTSNGLFSVYFNDTDTGYVAGIYGTILKTTIGGAFPVSLADLTVKSINPDICPNPSSDFITIETSAIPSKLSIINISGQELITTITSEPKTVIDISTLPGGVYFVRLTGGRTVQAGKFVKL